LLIIYHDIGGTHTTQVAALLHLNRLPFERTPSREELMSNPLFDQLDMNDMGRLFFAGEDEWGNSVYTLGRGYTTKITTKLLKDFFKELHGNDEELLLVNTSPTVSFTLKIGGFTSRFLKIVSIGRPLVIRGVQKSYPKIVQLVQSVKKQISQEKAVPMMSDTKSIKPKF